MKKVFLLLPIASLVGLVGCGGNSEPQVTKTYDIKFENYNGDILEEVTVEEGKLPVYSKATPGRQAPAEHEWIYTGWNKPIVEATEDTTYTATYDYVFLFGSYPQKETRDLQLIQNIKKYGTYNNQTGYISYNGNEYLEFSSLCNYIADDGARVHTGDVDYYEVMPIKWKILGDERYKFYTTYNLLDTGIYHAMESDPDVYANNYMYSDIREWMNTTFYNTAFSPTEKAKIAQSLVKNDKASTKDEGEEYVCDDTNDYVFSLSRQELEDESLGFINADNIDKARLSLTTDFARAKAATTFNNYGLYWTRSPSQNEWCFWDYDVYNVLADGYVTFNHCCLNGRCVRPAIKLI